MQAIQLPVSFTKHAMKRKAKGALHTSYPADSRQPGVQPKCNHFLEKILLATTIMDEIV